MGSYDRPEEVIDDAMRLGEDHVIPPAYARAPLAGAQRRVSNFVRDVGRGMAEDAAAIIKHPSQVSQPNPYPAGSEEADYFNAVNENKSQRWVPKVVEQMLTGGTAHALSRAGRNTLGIAGGRFSRNADLDALKTAENMHARGNSREAIRNTTGWWREPDGQWRFEYPTHDAYILNSQANTIGEMIDLKNVYAGHPDIEKIPVIRDPGTRAGEGGWGAVRVGGKKIPEALVVSATPGPLNDLKELAIHEVSHGLQKRNKFTLGGNPKNIERAVVQKMVDKGIPEEYITPGFVSNLAEEYYWRGGGEAAARAAAIRSRYSPDRLAREHPWETTAKDKALEDYIVSRKAAKDPNSLLIWAKPGEVNPDYAGVARSIKGSDPWISNANPSVHTPEIQDYLRTISTKPQGLMAAGAATGITQDEQDAIDETDGTGDPGTPGIPRRILEALAAQEARNAAAYMTRRKYRTEQGDPNRQTFRSIPKPRIPIDPKYKELPQSENMEDWRQIYNSGFMNKQLYDRLGEVGKDNMWRPPEEADTPPPMPGLEQEAGTPNWGSVYRQLQAQGRMPTSLPKLSPEQVDEIINGPKPTPETVPEEPELAETGV